MCLQEQLYVILDLQSNFQKQQKIPWQINVKQ